MDSQILLAQLRALMERAPNFETYSATSREHATWLGQAHALISRWNRSEAYGLQLASGNLTSSLMRDIGVGNIFGIIHRAIADLELSVPPSGEGVYAPGEVYNFFKDLNRLVATAEKSLFIVDPYLDSTVFDHYLHSRSKNVNARLLLGKGGDDLVAAAEKYCSQHGEVLDIRKSNKLHDRLIFIDGFVCWIVGQSLKDSLNKCPLLAS